MVYEINKYTKSIFYNETILDNYINENISREAWNKVYRKEILENIEYPIGRMAEDLATTYKVLYKCHKVVCINSNLYYYRIRKNSIMTSKSSKLFYDAMLAHYEIYESMKEKNILKKNKRRLYSNYYNNLMKIYSKILVESEELYKHELAKRISQIRYCELCGKSKIIFILSIFSKKILIKKIYDKYI